MIHYLDTSALVKRYVTEPGSAAVRRLFRRGQRAAIVRISHAELAAAVARLQREGALTAQARDRVLGRVAVDLGRLTIVEVRPGLVRLAAEIVTRHPLRGYDAVQLAGALTLRSAQLPVTLWAADGDLLEAALREGLRVVEADHA